jgi:hypothetical protein
VCPVDQRGQLDVRAAGAAGVFKQVDRRAGEHVTDLDWHRL